MFSDYFEIDQQHVKPLLFWMPMNASSSQPILAVCHLMLPFTCFLPLDVGFKGHWDLLGGAMDKWKCMSGTHIPKKQKKLLHIARQVRFVACVRRRKGLKQLYLQRNG